MTVEMMVTECCYCKKTLSCTITGSVIILKTECEGCEKDGSCTVVANKEIFGISSGICIPCLNYYYPERSNE